MPKPSGCDWMQIYSIYGTDEWQTVTFLIFHSSLFALLSFLLLIFFTPSLLALHSLLPSLPLPLLRFATAFSASLLSLSSLFLLFAAANLLYSSLPLRFHMAQRMLSAVPNWFSVRTALDLGCGRGILLNAVALQLKKEGSSGRVVGLDRDRDTAVSALRRAGAEGVQEYVTCREGDASRLPFPDGYFDVVLSAVYLGRQGVSVVERGRAIGEVVRVLRPGGMGVLWDLACVPEFVQRLKEMRMEEVRVSDRVTAYLASSYIVSFRKPVEVSVVEDWRANIC